MEAPPSPVPAPPCPGCAERDRRIAQLEAQLSRLQGQVEGLREQLAGASRASKRQAAPFSKGLPKPQPKTPGRKAGPGYGTHHRRAVPPQVDETYEAALPDRCPFCGSGSLLLTEVAEQYQVEVPRKPIYRLFNVHVGCCRRCRRRVQGRHELQTSDALGACASQLGPDAQAAVAVLNKTLGLSHGKVATLFQTLFGIDLSRGGSCRVMLRSARRQEDNYQAVVRQVRASEAVTPDETGWRVGGLPAWLHVAVAEQAVAYLVARERGFVATEQLLGAGYAGRMTHDGWAPYRRFWRARHQLCVGHLLRRCRELLESARGGAVRFPRQVKAVLQEALAVRDARDAGELTAAAAAAAADRLQRRVEQLVWPVKAHEGNERLAGHLWERRAELFLFLRERGVDATNYKAEQAIRPAVVNRKVWGGNRTDAGARAQSVLMSVLQTLKLRGLHAIEFLSATLRALPGQQPLLLPSGP